MSLQAFAQRVVQSTSFQRAITGVILFAAVLVGVETDKAMVAAHGDLLHALDRIVLAIFCAEIVLKMVALSPKPWHYFRDPWNVFDFAIVVACLLPLGSQSATVLRLLRLLRVLRLVHALPRLQVLVGTLLKSLPSMGYVGLFLAMHFYVYGVAAVFLFGENDPRNFGSLPMAVLTLFIVVTGENWSTTLYTQMYGCENFGYEGMEALCTASNAQPVVASLFFVSFIVLGTMVILNLVIGVVMNSMQEAQIENERMDEAKRGGDERHPSLEHELFELRQSMAATMERVERLTQRVQAEER
ncbi:ion transporter [Silanimonas sp.]|jgi:voltage-gated sodium channel|uniref:ion transporter n=1 Tax=Silanimonas sp. TaxID=1929290 RepID=UPI0022C79FD7|nr:ion transporter [Silanimonas sp.]MCZ8113653.1 ion transporter [Silanimonas sp.]